VNEPTILLADEPTGNLDTRNSQVIMDLFKSLNGKGITIVMVTHSMECAKNANRIFHLSDGLLAGEEVFDTEAAYQLESGAPFETTQQSLVRKRNNRIHFSFSKR
jgi:ABC-type lipoprotein export system ATPase subunit